MVKPTHILYGANLSHARLNRYLGMLIEQGFIEQTNKAGRMYYRLTKKGEQFISEFKKVEQLTEAFGISL